MSEYGEKSRQARLREPTIHPVGGGWRRGAVANRYTARLRWG